MRYLTNGGVMKTRKDLDVWKNGKELVVSVYKATRKYSNDELYGLVSQIRRAAVSIPSNIAEGAGRNHDREYIQFLYVALGSLAELETQLLISQRLDFISEQENDDLNSLIKMIRSQISGLIKYLKEDKK